MFRPLGTDLLGQLYYYPHLVDVTPTIMQDLQFEFDVPNTSCMSYMSIPWVYSKPDSCSESEASEEAELSFAISKDHDYEIGSLELLFYFGHLGF